MCRITIAAMPRGNCRIFQKMLKSVQGMESPFNRREADDPYCGWSRWEFALQTRRMAGFLLISSVQTKRRLRVRLRHRTQPQGEIGPPNEEITSKALPPRSSKALPIKQLEQSLLLLRCRCGLADWEKCMGQMPLGFMIAVTLSFVAMGLLVIAFDVSPILIAIIFMAGYAIYLEYYIRSKNGT
jgi:hypothetical protein